MLLRWTCLVLIFFVAFASLEGRAANPRAAAEPSGPRNPNIILIMADDMGYECVGANGGGSYETPNLDRLAAGGMRFTYCYSQPICTPSRVQIMTGRYNSRNYIRFGLLDPEAYTFGNLLRESGYATCVVGKWQLEGGFDAPDNFGFDEYCLWQLTRRPGRYPNPGLEINGRKINFTDGEYGPDIACDYALDFIERHRDEPFFLYYPMILPHWPFEPTPDSPDWDPSSRGILRGHGDRVYFDDMVAYTDKIVGRIVKKLDALGLRENTLVLFTGDNGTSRDITSMLNGRKVEGGKGHMTDAGTHVPLIVSRPGTVPGGRINGDLIDFSDFFPTLAEVAGAKVPERLAIDGRSFAAELRGREVNRREWTYCWYFRNGKPGDRWGGEFARTHRYKFYRDGRFYDLADDPREQHPLKVNELDALAEQARRTLRKAIEQHTRDGFYSDRKGRHGATNPADSSQ